MSESTPDHTPAGWPYLTDDHYIDLIGAYTVELADKLQNSDADVAAAINAAQQALAYKNAVEALAAGDTDWTTLAVLAGFTAGTGANTPQWRIKGGVVYWRGRVTRQAGNWPAALTLFANIPSAAQPDGGLIYAPAIARGAVVLLVAVDSTLRVTTAASTAEIELNSIPPYIAAGR